MRPDTAGLRKHGVRAELGLLFVVLTVTVALTGAAAAPIAAGAEPRAGSATGQLGSMLAPDGTLNLPPGFRGSLDAKGWQLVSGENEPPRFAPLSSEGAGDSATSTEPDAPRVAGDEKWAAGFHSNGTSDSVNAIVAGAGGEVYVAGYFATAGEAHGYTGAASIVAKWDGIRWSAVGNGFSDNVKALAWDGANNWLYAGGYFNYLCSATECATNQVNHIAKWDGTSWTALGKGVDNTVFALALDESNNLYAGGSFDSSCNEWDCSLATPLKHVGKWALPSGPWSALGGGADIGVDDTVYALAWYAKSDRIVIGGSFHNGWGAPAMHLASWTLSEQGQACGGVDATVRTLVYEPYGEDIYLGGEFDSLLAGGVHPGSPCRDAAVWVNHIARFNEGNAARGVAAYWGPLRNGLSGPVRAIVLDPVSKYIYAGGDFAGSCTSDLCTETLPAPYIARWQGTWAALGSGVNFSVSALALNGGLYVGGGFSIAGNAGASHIARWNDPNWSPLGEGEGIHGGVSAVVADGQGSIYVGGDFRAAGSLLVNSIAKWNGSAWSTLGYGLRGSVGAIALDGNGNLFAGGEFDSTCPAADCLAPGTRLNHIGKWDGTTWSMVGNGLVIPTQIGAMVIDHHGNLYVGGLISGICASPECPAPGIPVHNLVKWSGPSGPWTSVDNGVNGAVLALAVNGVDNVYVGGHFPSVCANAGCTDSIRFNRIAKWGGTGWGRLEYGVDNDVLALAIDRQGKLYVGGDMQSTCGNELCSSAGLRINHIGLWSPSGTGGSWSRLSYGLENDVNSLVLGEDGNLFAGGHFIHRCSDENCVNKDSDLYGIAEWSAGTWSPLGSGLRYPNGLAELVMGVESHTLAWQRGRLSVGESFMMAGGRASTAFAQYQDTNYLQLPIVTR